MPIVDLTTCQASVETVTKEIDERFKETSLFREGPVKLVLTFNSGPQWVALVSFKMYQDSLGGTPIESVPCDSPDLALSFLLAQVRVRTS